jgi:phosphomannomutase
MTNSHPYEIDDRDLVTRVLAWRDQDPDAETRAELDALLAAGDEPGLRDRFDSRIGFGTAGLRGELGAGPNRMNRVLVAQAAAGIAAYLKNIGGKSVVIGYDARINSDVFARDSAAIFAGAGLDVLLFDGYVPTPVLAFATKFGTAQADGSTSPYDIGVMVTASHNPPRDNGYKVYAGSLGGSQIIAPVDKLIAEQINLAAASLSFESIPKSESFTVGGGEILDAYVKRASELAAHTEGASLRVTFTAMHGVGWDTAARVFASAGLPEPLPVAAQTEPDGTFPTVAFPNPEEPGALDLAIEQANSIGSDLIIALDPDADRLAVAVPDADAATGWSKLTGDQVGFILGHRAAQLAHAEGRTGTLACSIASSSALKSVAQHFGLGFQQTLTGFKWISKVPGLIFGFEEALGYCIDPGHTPDKDGITAAVVLVSLAQELAAEGKTLAQHLLALEQQFGFTATSQVTLRFASVTQAIQVVAGLRANPPVELLHQALAFEDLALAQSGLPATDGLRFTLTDGRTALIRPSGTEPKLKCYLQATGTSDSGAKHALSELETAFRTLLGA